MGLEGAGGRRVKKKNLNMVMWHIKLKGMMIRTETSKIFTFWGALRRGQISLNFNYKVNSNIFILNFVCVFTNKDIKYMEQDFHSVTWVMPYG